MMTIMNEVEKDNVCYLALGLLELAGAGEKVRKDLEELKNGSTFYQANVQSTIQKYLVNAPKLFIELIKQMLDPDARNRPTIEMIRKELKTSKTQEIQDLKHKIQVLSKILDGIFGINLSIGINLSNQNFGAEAAKYLGQNTSWINLQKLNLSFNSIGSEGAKYLSQSTTWINLQELILDHNSIGAEGAQYLSQNASWKNLQTLNLSLNSIGDEGAKYLAENTSWINLQTLNLQQNSFGAEGAKYLGQNTSWKILQTLNLKGNSIGAEGAKYLAENSSWVKLQTLAVNSIGDEGAKYLSQNASWISLSSLQIDNQRIFRKKTSKSNN